MRNNKRKASFGWAAGRHKNLVMERRARRLRLGSVVEVKTDAYLSDWVLEQIGGRRGVVIMLNDIGWETDHNGRRYIVGRWDSVVRFPTKSSHRKEFGLDAYKLNVISPRQLREERREKNAARRERIFQNVLSYCKCDAELMRRLFISGIFDGPSVPHQHDFVLRG